MVIAGAFINAPDTAMDVTGVMAGFDIAFAPALCNAPATDIGFGEGVLAAVPPGGIPPGGRGLLGGVAIGVGWFIR